MRRIVIPITALAAAALLAAGVARAITYGQPDGPAHPYVGLVALYHGDHYEGRCSGVLISATVVLTAAHCIAETNADRARVYFDPTVLDDLTAPPTARALLGTPHANPAFTDLAALPNTSDLAVVVLDSDAPVSSYASVARVGALNGSKGATLMVVGYGLQGVKPRLLDEKTRFVATPKVTALDGKIEAGWNVRTTNDKKGGGTCFGDSGAPLLLEGTNIVVALNSFGKNDTCKGHDYSYRVDTAYAQSWIAGFLGK